MLHFLLALWAIGPSKYKPYFVYLKTSSSRAIRIRKGPSPKSHVACILTTPKYPLKVIRDYDHWKQIADPEGTLGWVHKSFVVSSEKRYGITLSKCTLVQKDKHRVLAKLPVGFIIELIHKVDKNWFVLVKDPTDNKKMTGLIPCSAVWGE